MNDTGLLRRPTAPAETGARFVEFLFADIRGEGFTGIRGAYAAAQRTTGSGSGNR